MGKLETCLEKILKELSGEVGEDVVQKNVENILKSKEMKALLKIPEVCSEEFVLRKLKVYRELVKKLKKIRYYERRKFRSLEGKEISIDERGEKVFEVVDKVAEIFKTIGGVTLLDIGCGEFPLFLGNKLPSGTIYIAIDSRKEIIESLKAFKSNGLKLIPVLSDATEIDFRELLRKHGITRVDLTLLLRTLRVLQRTRRIDPVEFIESIPTRALLISEPLKSLVKEESIERRERKYLISIARKLEERGIFAYYEIWSSGSEIFVLLK